MDISCIFPVCFPVTNTMKRGWSREMSTYFPKSGEIERKWYVVDAEDQVVGRLASRIASVLMGKDKPCYTDFLDTGDFVVVVNAEKVRLTGKKWSDKVYYSHSGYPGGLKQSRAEHLLNQHPERLLQLAVKGMLPKTKLGRSMFKKLKVYAGNQHPHQAQNPEVLTF
jgi:large subunit ribosomal protein L13